MVPDYALGQQMLRERRRMDPGQSRLGHVFAGAADLKRQACPVETDLTARDIRFSF